MLGNMVRELTTSLFSFCLWCQPLYAKTPLVQDIVPVQYNAPFIYMTNDCLTMLWPSGRFRKNLCWLLLHLFEAPDQQPLLRFHDHSCCRSCPRCMPRYSSNHFSPRSCFLCMRLCFLPFCFVKFTFCQAEMRVLLISQLKAFFYCSRGSTSSSRQCLHV